MNYGNPISREILMRPIREIRSKVGLKPISDGYMRSMPFSKLEKICEDMKSKIK